LPGTSTVPFLLCLHKKLAILYEPDINLFESIQINYMHQNLSNFKDHFQQINTDKPFPGRVKSSTEKIVFK